MRVASLAIAISVLEASAASAGQPMTPSDIKAQPFTAASPSGTKFTMTFTPDGKMTRQALGPSGKANVGI